MESKKLRQNILACYISDAILGTFFQLPIWFIYQATFLNFEQIAFYAGLALITEVVMQLPTGAFADLYGRRISLALGNLFMALPMFLIALYPTQDIMVWYSIMWGLGRAFCMGTNKPMLYETLESEGKVAQYPKILSVSTVIFQVSAALSIVLGGYLYQYSPQLPYYVSGGASLLGLFTAFLFIEPKLEKKQFNLKNFLRTNLLGFQEIFKNAYASRLTILFVLMMGLANVNQQFFAQPYMVELGMSVLERSWAAMLIKIVIAVLGARIITNLKIVQKKWFVIVLPSLMVLTLLPASVVSLPLAYVLIFGIAFASGNTNLFFAAEINQNITSSLRSTAVSAQKMLASLFGAVVQWLSGPVVSATTVGTFYSYLGGFSLLVLLPLSWGIMKRKLTTSSGLIPG